MDWIRMGWGSSLEQNFSSRLNYTLDCEKLKVTNNSFLSISSRYINEISKLYPKPYYLMSSGGIDSQAMIYCWLKSGISFNILSYKYNDFFNDHDISTLQEFSKIHQLSVEYRNFDLLKFLDNSLNSYASTYQCTSPQICAFMSICDEIKDGTIIFSGNLLNKTSIGLDYTILGLKRYSDQRKNMIPFFFQSDRELAGSLFPYYRFFNNKNEEDYQIKIEAYKWAKIPIIPQCSKLSGYEKIKDFIDTKPNLINNKDRLEFSNFPSKRVFDIHYRYKLTRVIKYIDKCRYLLPKYLNNQNFWNTLQKNGDCNKYYC